MIEQQAAPNEVLAPCNLTAGVQHELTEGHLQLLLRLAVDEQQDLSVRQAAAINFKNTLNRHWEGKKGTQTGLQRAAFEPPQQR
jgi:hypothetical protein